MSVKKADPILDRDLKKAGFQQDKSRPGVYYKGKDQVHADHLTYSHKDKPFTVFQHLKGKKIK